MMEYRSEKIDEIVAMLIKARPELLKIEPDRKGNRGDYVSRDRVLSAVNTILAPLGGQVIPCNRHKDNVGLIMGIILTHGPSHQWLISDYTIDEFVDYTQGDTNHKKGGSFTYGLRYTIGSMLGISFGDDDFKPSEGKTISKETAKKLHSLYEDRPDLKATLCNNLKIDSLDDVYEHEVNQVIKFYKDQTGVK